MARPPVRRCCRCVPWVPSGVDPTRRAAPRCGPGALLRAAGALLLLALPARAAGEQDYYISVPTFGALYRIDAVSGAMSPFATGLSIPFYGLWASDGNLYMPDRGLGFVFRIDAAGTVTPFAGGGLLDTPVTVVQAVDGTLVVSDIFSDRIVALDAAGGQTLLADGPGSGGLLSGPGGLTYGPDGTLYVANNLSNTIAAVDPAGGVSLVSDGNGLLALPGGVAADGAGNLFVANYGTSNLVRIRIDTGETQVFSDDPFLVRPNDVRLSRSGAILSTLNNGALVSFDPAGQMTVLHHDPTLGPFDGVAVPADHPPCSGRFLPYGQGLAGSGGFVPELRGLFSPCPGATAGLEATGLLGGSSGSLLWALAPGSIPFKQGTLLVDVTGPWGLIPMLWPGSGPGGGAFLLSFEFPADPVLSGLSLYLQAAASDPGAPGGVSLSNGLEERIGS